ncbi:MAG: DNA repair protein RecO [Rhodospirillales bacterium]|nr:DNA repair protein RecO [Alphaproteobacteria bacterium]MBL6947767.1 DNA repair protein RecO [Rhodospirillales bacterium]
MDWTDDGIVLSARKHGETSSIVTLLTRQHGRHLGLVRGGNGKRARGILQPGNRVEARWQARLSEHLGTYQCEMTEAFAAQVLRDPLKLAGLSAACTVAEGALAEREPHRPVYDGLLALLRTFGHDDWASAYVKWELGLLGEAGFALDLSACAATGQNDQLAYVSPKSGRAVSLAAGEPYKDKMLPLPEFLLQPGASGSPVEVMAGLKLTGYFLEKYIFHHAGKGLPAARNRLAERLRDMSGESRPVENR